VQKIVPNLPEQSFVLGGIGELHANKNWSAAISALSLLPEHMHLVIIGTGEEQEKLSMLATKHSLTEHVHFATVPERAAQYMELFDIFILPSHKEGLPYVLLEAGLARRPVIASDLPGIHDIITDTESGILVSPTPENIAARVEGLSNDSETRVKYGDALYKHVSETFNMNSMVQKTFAIYEN